MPNELTVVKRDFRGVHQLSYQGTIRERGERHICIEAQFAFEDRDLGYINLRKGDLFTEWFYDNRWYNIFRVQDVDSQQLKGWYCNITRPAEITPHQVAADDLALDVFVYPDGRTLLLDQDEFDELDLPPHEQQLAWDAVVEIKRKVNQREYPFDEIGA